MRAGRYDKRVEIQEATETRDAHGTVTRSWSKVATRWARIEYVSGREYFDSQAVKSDVTVRITLRQKYDGLNPNHRIVHGSSTYNVDHVLASQRNQYGRGQECMCTEVL